jgi:peptidoglycan L-alanyl-D-glutamate endopeptidase CwlK
MRNNKSILLLFVVFVIMTSSFIYKNKSRHLTEDKWTGTIHYKRTSNKIGNSFENGVKSEWNVTSTFTVTGTFGNKKDSAIRKENSVTWNKHTSKYTSTIDHVEETKTEIVCNVNGPVKLSVEIDRDSKTYRIGFDIPSCQQTITSTYKSNLFPHTNSSNANENSGSPISIPAQRLGKNPKVLSGTIEDTRTDPGGEVTITTITWNLRTACPPWNNPLTQKNINTLDARVRGPATRFIKRVNDELCIKLKVASALRTKEEQDKLFAQGRDKDGKVIGETVTNAKGGESYHNLGLAIDVYMVNDDGTIDLKGILPPEVVAIAKQEGFEWGGDWKKFKDYPHFEMKF